MDMGSIQADVYKWASEKIVGCTWRGITKHMEHEIVELNAELVQWEILGRPEDRHTTSPEIETLRARTGMELADLVILACHASGILGIDLEKCVLDKMIINKQRVWSLPDPETQVIHHI